MNDMHMSGFDLNLLTVFDAIFRERSVTGAGKRLHLTQSAMSHALGRLRDQFGDPLFVRQGNRMEPTPLAVRLHGTIHSALSAVKDALEDRGEFVPERSERVFSLGLSDYSVMVLLPRLLARFREEAPGVRLRVVQTTYEQRAALLNGGTLDLIIGSPQDYGANIRGEYLFSDREVCILRRDHPDIGDTLDYAQFIRSQFVALSFSESGQDLVEESLSRAGEQRNIMVTVQQELTIPRLVSSTDYVGTMAERLAREFVRTLPIKALPVPLPDVTFEMHQYWHASTDNDPAHHWLRACIREESAALE